jgi:hypothetical protein
MRGASILSDKFIRTARQARESAAAPASVRALVCDGVTFPVQTTPIVQQARSAWLPIRRSMMVFTPATEASRVKIHDGIQ